jgi:hypothetical protein
MDVSRAVLENLMGRDRNKCKDKITERDHYSNPDVIFLIYFNRSVNLFWYVFASILFFPIQSMMKVLVTRDMILI